MARVIADMTMSLDGFIPDPADGIGELFGWFGNGDVETTTHNEAITFRTTGASAAVLRDALENVGALVCGRRLYDLTHGWGGSHPTGAPIFVVTHEAPAEPFAPGATFVTDGVASAVAPAEEAAGDGVVSVASAAITQQCLVAGLLDEVSVPSVVAVGGVTVGPALRHARDGVPAAS
ncbi:dihydrofolate reductase family protein [Pseudonocardia sp. N23]|uniref:dihydrofolate reductase family protein n=1 Tax=Pseudonocardia sp. N23 TaxID=1987376 RepID=UPI000C02E11C|nr:deaminase [Pseudonocardia sp. N23]GAY13178.1 bifunctional deaminase-reductase domain protein [Pseudonocardia sp. N23]